MPHDPPCRGTHDSRVKMLLATCGSRCRLASLDDLVRAIRETAKGKGKNWSWIDQWAEDEGRLWVNDMNTVVFEFPSTDLTGERCLEFTQMIWRCQPRDFWYQVWGDRCFVRLWWDPNRRLNG